MSLLTRLVAAAAFTACASASATIIDFNDYAAAANNGTVLGSISTEGYNFSSPHGHVITNVSTCATTCADNGTQYVGGDMTSLLIDMGGAGFSIGSFDFAEAFANQATPTQLTVQAVFLDGSSITNNFAFDGVYDGAGALLDFQNLTVDLINLSSLRLSANGYFSVDNIDTEVDTEVPVPEPAILSLLAMGLGSLGLSRRRK